MRLIKLTQILCCIGFVCLTATAQTQSNIAEAVKLYDKGDYQAAAVALQEITKSDSKNGEAFYYLGAAQIGLNDLKTAEKSLKKAVKLSPQDVRPAKTLTYSLLLQNKIGDAKKQAANAVALVPKDAEAHFLLGLTNLRDRNEKVAAAEADQAIALNKTFASAYSLKADALIFNAKGWYGSTTPAERTQRFQAAVQIIQTYPNLNSPKAQALRDKLETYQAFAEYFAKREKFSDEDSPPQPAPPDPSVKPLEIILKPRAEYTEDARRNQVSGKILMLVMLSKTGVIGDVLVLKGLSNGLTEQAVNAARQVKFKPEEKNGRSVSVVKMIEYQFYLY